MTFDFGDDKPFETQRAIVRRAFDLGITHFDLANNYGPPYGSAEENFGRHIAADLRPYRDELIISTKAGYDMWPGPYGEWGSRKYLLASLDQSLSRMGLDYVDIFYSHRFDPDTPLEETMGALATAVQQGKALYVGISSHSPELTRQAEAMLRAAKPDRDEATEVVELPEELRLSLGARAWQRFMRVTLPLVWPGAVAGTLLAFVIALGEYVASVLVFVPANRPISIAIASELRDFNLGAAAAYGVILVVIISISMIVAGRLERHPDGVLEYGVPLRRVGDRGKHLLLDFGDVTFVVHLMQGGRLRPDTSKAKRPRNGVARWPVAQVQGTDGQWRTAADWPRKPGGLTAPEWEVMREHPAIGARRLSERSAAVASPTSSRNPRPRSTPSTPYAARLPKPGMVSGLVKSQSFSCSPTKSRIAGSLIQARRSAARDSDTGTPGLRKSRMSVPAVIDSTGGRLAGCSITSRYMSAT